MMDRKVSIPVRVVRPGEYQAAPPSKEGAIPAARPHLRKAPVKSAAVENSRTPVEQAEPEAVVQDGLREELEEWRDRALRFQADMDNYRKRQQRSAQDQIRQERSRLLNAFLGIVDDLERALATPSGEDRLSYEVGLRRGVELTHRAAMQLLEKEGVVAVAAERQPFDPNWHEAVATVPQDGSELAPGTVIQVVEPGYRLDDQLLRPAKVVVIV